MLKWCQHRVLPTTCGCGAYQAECSAYPRLAAPCQMGGGYFCSRCSLDTDKPQWTLTNDIIWLLPCLPLLCLTSLSSGSPSSGHQLSSLLPSPGWSTESGSGAPMNIPRLEWEESMERAEQVAGCWQAGKPGTQPSWVNVFSLALPNRHKKTPSPSNLSCLCCIKISAGGSSLFGEAGEGGCGCFSYICKGPWHWKAHVS